MILSEPEPTRWRVELHLDGLPTDEQQFAIVSYPGTSITGDHNARLAVVIHLCHAETPAIPVMNAVAIVSKHAPSLKINAVQATRSMTEREAVAWVKRQFDANSVSWKDNLNF